MPKTRAESGRHGSAYRPAKRTVREWAARGVLVAGVLMVGYVSVTSSLANVLVRADAQAANRLAFADGRILAAAAAQKFTAAPNSARSSEQAILANEALRLDPTAVDALNVLGVQAQMRSENALADRLFGYSFALSRRELGPQIWSIEKAVTRGDIDQALHNYDLAMRTSEEARQILFPVLATAVSEPRIRRRLIDLLASEPVWGQPFLQFASTSGSDPTVVAQLLREGTEKGLSIGEADQARILNRLVARNQMDEAWAYYETVRRNVIRNRSRDPDFSLGTDTPTPFDWTVGSTPGLSAAILRGGDSGFLDFAVPAGARATAVRQVQMLPPGNYQLVGRSRGIDQPERSPPFWAISCRGGAELVRVDVPNSDEGVSEFSGQFSVPSDCLVQTLSFVLRASDKVSGVTGQIEYLQVAPSSH